LGAVAPATAWSASAAGTVATPPDDELAGLVQSRSDPAQPPRSASDPYPPSTRSGRRPSVSSTRPTGDPGPGPTWERIRRYEAYPTIKTRAGLPGLSRLAVLGGAVAIAALALFMLPALLGIGGGGSSSPKPSASRPAPTGLSSPTVPPAPTPQVYVIKQGDTLLKVAKAFGLTLDELLAANPQITNPNRIGLGQEIAIPAPGSGSSARPSASAKASGSAAH
jgi:hypothetical protein